MSGCCPCRMVRDLSPETATLAPSRVPFRGVRTEAGPVALQMVVGVMAPGVCIQWILAVTRYSAIHPHRWPRFDRVTYRTALQASPALPVCRSGAFGHQARRLMRKWSSGDGSIAPGILCLGPQCPAVLCRASPWLRPGRFRCDQMWVPPGSGSHGNLIDKEDPSNVCNERTPAVREGAGGEHATCHDVGNRSRNASKDV
jgi:hypothetical protein